MAYALITLRGYVGALGEDRTKLDEPPASQPRCMLISLSPSAAMRVDGDQCDTVWWTCSIGSAHRSGSSRNVSLQAISQKW